MKVAYFDCFAGISGDMTLGALVDAGASVDALREGLSLLPLQGYELRDERVRKSGICVTDVTVVTDDHHHSRHLSDIAGIISSSGLSASIKEKSLRIFQRLAEAEAKVHGCSVDHVHFHEVGAVDAIVDIVGSVICLDLLSIERVVGSPLPVPRGFVESAHGRIPLPAPATVELTQGVPTYGVDLEGEMVTPTGAAILTTLASGYGPMPPMKVESTGYGAGKLERAFPNVLRLFVGEGETDFGAITEPLVMLETNIDDMNPQAYDMVMKRLLAAGARDVFLTPIQMKKNRPATLLSALCDKDKVSEMLSIVFRETSTLGVRIQEVHRACIERVWQTVETQYGPIRIKLGIIGADVMNAAPEYEDCLASASEHEVPWKEVHDAAIAAFRVGTSNPST